MVRSVWLLGLIAALFWGVAAFGSPYPWAYQPLLIACSVLGVSGLWIGWERPLPLWILIGSVWLLLAIGVQLVPLPTSTLDALSPQAQRVIRLQDLAFVAEASPRHPLSVAPNHTRLGMAFVVALLLLVLGTARVMTRTTAERFAASVGVVGAVLAIVGIAQRATFNGKIYGFWELAQGGNPFGPFVNKNHFAGWMLMGLPVVLGYALAQVSGNQPPREPGLRGAILWFATPRASRLMLAVLAAVLMMLSLMLTLSRSGIAGLLLAFAVTLIFLGRHHGSAKRAMVLVVFAGAMLAVSAWVGVGDIALRFSQLDLAGVDQRPAIWRDTFRIIRDFWLVGTGLNTYGVSTLVYQTAVTGEHLREAHNDYLQLAAEGGLLLALPTLALVAAHITETRKRLKSDTSSIRWVRVGAITGLVAIGFQSLVEFSLQMPANAALFAAVAGVAMYGDDRDSAARRAHRTGA